jgi:hypothetical protein
VAVNYNLNSETVLRDLYRLLTRMAACRHTPLTPFIYAAGSYRMSQRTISSISRRERHAIRSFTRTTSPLKRVGYYLYTFPIRKYLVAARAPLATRNCDGSVHHLTATPEYHGNPIDEKGVLVTCDCGYDISKQIARWAPSTSEFSGSEMRHTVLLVTTPRLLSGLFWSLFRHRRPLLRDLTPRRPIDPLPEFPHNSRAE